MWQWSSWAWRAMWLRLGRGLQGYLLLSNVPTPSKRRKTMHFDTEVNKFEINFFSSFWVGLNIYVLSNIRVLNWNHKFIRIIMVWPALCSFLYGTGDVWAKLYFSTKKISNYTVIGKPPPPPPTNQLIVNCNSQSCIASKFKACDSWHTRKNWKTEKPILSWKLSKTLFAKIIEKLEFETSERTAFEIQELKILCISKIA